MFLPHFDYDKTPKTIFVSSGLFQSALSFFERRSLKDVFLEFGPTRLFAARNTASVTISSLTGVSVKILLRTLHYFIEKMLFLSLHFLNREEGNERISQ